MAAGDIVCGPDEPGYNGGNGTADECHMKATAELVGQINPDVVLALGDEQYHDGVLSKFEQAYGPTWGRYKAITRPVPGNHEHQTGDPSGYYTYFRAIAGDPSKGYYSYDVGAWHMVALNSNCDYVGGCQAGSPQERWLRADLASHPSTCTLAYWHQPRFSSGIEHGNDLAYDAFWRALYDYHADIVLNGHDHDYERFATQDPDERRDRSGGIREFVVGTGGKSLRDFGPNPRPNSKARNDDTFGVLKLALYPSGYDWVFVPEVSKTFTDSGSDGCHGRSKGFRPPAGADAGRSGRPFGLPPALPSLGLLPTRARTFRGDRARRR